MFAIRDDVNKYIAYLYRVSLELTSELVQKDARIS